MARVTLVPERVDAATGLPLAANVLTFTAADVTDFNRFRHTGKEVLLVRNTGATPRNVKFQSVAIGGRQDALHNTNIAIPAGETHLFNFLGPGWRQSSGADEGYVQVDGDNAELTFCVLQLP